jgi:hypothetical protein
VKTRLRRSDLLLVAIQTASPATSNGTMLATVPKISASVAKSALVRTSVTTVGSQYAPSR